MPLISNIVITPDMGVGYETQKRIGDALANDPAIQAFKTNGVKVYDDVPQGEDTGDTDFYPYITIGEDIITEDDTDCTLGWRVSVTVHVWSRHHGRSVVKRLQHLIYKALHRATLPYAYYQFIGCDFVSTDTLLESDGVTRHGIQTFNIILDQLGV